MEGGGAGADERAGWIKTNRGVASCIAGVAVLLLLYLATSDWAFLRLRDGFHLGTFTTVSVFAMLICAVALMLDRRRHETDEEMTRSSWLDWAVAAVAMVACYVYFELAWRFDFLLVTPIFLAGGTYVLGVRPLRSAIVAAVTITIVTYVLFRLIGIELPTFLLWF